MMLKERLLHTPDGVRDIYSSECSKKTVLQNRIHDVLKAYGYSDIQTPTFEFFDVFNKERGSIASNELFKFFDRDGNTLVLRPDITPSIARVAAKYFGDAKAPLKLCYNGNTFINNHSLQGRLKETTQIGAELIGDASIYADAEIIAIVIDCLLNSGLKEFQVEVGHAQFVHGLLLEAGVEGDIEAELIEFLKNKNYYGVEELLHMQNIDAKLADKLLQLPQLFGSCEVFHKARQLTKNEETLKSIAYLEKLYHLIENYGYDKYMTIDIGMLGRHKYYTGVMFNAYTYGTGDAVVQGGRYDKLIGQFGKDKPSIGFSLTVDRLTAALERQKIEIPVDYNGTLVVYSENRYQDALVQARQMRDTGTRVNMVQDMGLTQQEYQDYADSCNMDSVVYITDKEVQTQ